jgi:anti-anti-sigma regulatory factor
MNDHSARKDVPDGKAVKIECDLTIENVASLKAFLIASLKEGDRLIIDPSEVTAVDVAGLQLLCSAHRTALLTNKEFVLAGNITQVFRQAVKDSGYARNEGCMTLGESQCIWIGGETDG